MDPGKRFTIFYTQKYGKLLCIFILGFVVLNEGILKVCLMNAISMELERKPRVCEFPYICNCVSRIPFSFDQRFLFYYLVFSLKEKLRFLATFRNLLKDLSDCLPLFISGIS